jgi:hypothetical protein
MFHLDVIRLIRGLISIGPRFEQAGAILPSLCDSVPNELVCDFSLPFHLNDSLSFGHEIVEGDRIEVDGRGFDFPIFHPQNLGDVAAGVVPLWRQQLIMHDHTGFLTLNDHFLHL